MNVFRLRIVRIFIIMIPTILIGMLTMKKSNMVQFIFFLPINFLFISILISQILLNPKSRFAQSIVDIINFGIAKSFVFIYYVALISHILGPLILVFGGQFIVLILINKYIFHEFFIDSTIIYLSGLSTFCILAYKSYWLVKIAIRLFTKPFSSLEKSYNVKIIDHFQKYNFRKICYLSSIVICIVLNAINLTVGSVILDNFTAIMDKILLTFVAIDCYICTFNSDLFKKTNMELEKLYNEVL